MSKLNNWFREKGREQTCLKGDVLFLRGDRSRGPFFVKSGQIRLYRQDEDGREITLHRARTGELFAEASIFSEAYHCDCLAEKKSTVIAIPKIEFIKAIESQPAFAAEFSKILARQVTALRTQLELRNIRSADERILSAFLLKAGEPGIPFRLDGTLKAFAAEIGLTHEALYRSINKLVKNRRLKREGITYIVP
jgi:CRP/FNR family transcriptional regulator, dissimilatory nitrate respiration regulator